MTLAALFILFVALVLYAIREDRREAKRKTRPTILIKDEAFMIIDGVPTVPLDRRQARANLFHYHLGGRTVIRSDRLDMEFGLTEESRATAVYLN